MTEQTKLSEISNPAAAAWRWEWEGREHEIVWIRGTHSIRFCTKTDDGTWAQTAISSPERFGFDGTLKGARAAAQAFVNG